MTSIWLRAALLLVAALVAGLAAWPLAGPHWALASASAVLLLALWRHTVNLAALADWLRDPLTKPVPPGSGVWEDIFSALHRFVRGRTQQELRLTGDVARFRNAGLALPDGVILLDADGHIEWCNPIASQYFGLDEVRDRGQTLINLVRHPDFVAYMERGEFADPFTLYLMRGDHLVLSLAVIAYGHEQKLLLASDITLAEKVETMRRDFVANVSHELKSPLTVVAGFLETLTDSEVKLDDRRRQGYLEMMRDHTARMQRLVEDLLTLSSLESSSGPSDETWIDVGPLLASVRDEALALSAGRHRIELALANPAMLQGNAQELRSAFGNLLSNAVRYTPEGGEIKLAWEPHGAEAVLSVTDSGIGIEPRHIPRLTERFYRVDSSRSRETGGTGLGLAIVKHVLTRHQAVLDIASEPGRGSRFSVVFPARRIRPAAAPQAVIESTSALRLESPET